jgi:hypothetical protein
MNDALDAHFALLTRDEDLHPDLAPYLVEMRSGLMLKHPLVFSVMHTNQMNAWANEHYRCKLNAVAKARDAGDYSLYIWLHERPYRVYALQRIAFLLLAPDYWQLVSHVWLDSENVWQNRRAWRMFWACKMPQRELVMDDREREQLAALPETLAVYRGVKLRSAMRGLSWTLDRERAEWFANRFVMKRQHPMVLQSEVRKADVVAHFIGRNEAEIVVHPNAIHRLAIRIL